MTAMRAKMKILEEPLIDRIVDQACSILEKTGVLVEDTPSYERLGAAVRRREHAVARGRHVVGAVGARRSRRSPGGRDRARSGRAA